MNAFDFLDHGWFADGDPHATWTALRECDPVHWHEARDGRGFWLLTKHRDVVRASRDGETFVSERGVGLPGPQDRATPPDQPSPSPDGERLLNYLDPPAHGVMRKIIARSFTPATVQRLLPAVERALAQAFDEERASWADGRDFVEGFAKELPVRVLLELLGIPDDARERIVTWTHQMEPGDDDDFSLENQTRERTRRIAFAELVRYLRELIDDKQRLPRESVLAELLMAQDAGRLSDAEVSWFAILLVNAGHETVRNALAGGVLALIQHPAELERLRDPTLVDSAVEEVLRWTSPIVFFGRFVKRDTQLGDKQIRAGQRVLLLYPSANRDEDVFTDPFRFDVGRTPNEHVAFGIGHHFCLGASLARMQLRLTISALARKADRMELAGPVRRTRSNFNAGLKCLPIRAAIRTAGTEPVRDLPDPRQISDREHHPRSADSTRRD